MHLTPREQERLMIFVAADVARRIIRRRWRFSQLRSSSGLAMGKR
jgi:urease gamma subunit